MAKRRSGPTLIQQSRRKSPEEKALYHQELGAGRSGVTRKFLGLTAQDENDILALLDKRIDTRLQNL